MTEYLRFKTILTLRVWLMGSLDLAIALAQVLEIDSEWGMCLFAHVPAFVKAA